MNERIQRHEYRAEVAKDSPPKKISEEIDTGAVLLKETPITDKDLERAIEQKKERKSQGQDFGYFEEIVDVEQEKIKPIYKKIGEILRIVNQDILVTQEIDSFSFEHKGQEIGVYQSSGEGEYIGIKIDKDYLGYENGDIYVEHGRESKRTEFFDEESSLIAGKKDIEEAERMLDSVIEALKILAKASPEYRALKDSNSDVQQNFGLNVRNIANELIGKAPLGTVFKVVFKKPKSPYVFVHYLDRDRELQGGYVHSGYLEEPTSSFSQAPPETVEVPTVSMRVSDSSEPIKKIGGLRLRVSPKGRPLGKIPAGTIVEVSDTKVIQMIPYGESKWGKVKYTDKKGKVQEGWACIYEGKSRYLLDI